MSDTREKDLAAYWASQPHENPRASKAAYGAERFAMGCAHRDAQVIAFLNSRLRGFYAEGEDPIDLLMDLIGCIERGEHVK